MSKQRRHGTYLYKCVVQHLVSIGQLKNGIAPELPCTFVTTQLILAGAIRADQANALTWQKILGHRGTPEQRARSLWALHSIKLLMWARTRAGTPLDYIPYGEYEPQRLTKVMKIALALSSNPKSKAKLSSLARIQEKKEENKIKLKRKRELKFCKKVLLI